eukprot:gene16645-18335_t
MAATFYTNAHDTLSKSLNISVKTEYDTRHLESYYDIARCVEFIRKNSYEKVALQFPDELLGHSFKVSKLIEEKVPESNSYVLGDTTYGSCCVDEVAAEHVKADCIIHFGRACLSPTRRLPVLYVYGTHPIDIKDCYSKFLEVVPDATEKIILFHDVVYNHAIDELFEMMLENYGNLIFAKLVEKDEGLNGKDVCEKCGGQKVDKLIIKTAPSCCGKCGSDAGLGCDNIAKLKITNWCRCGENKEKEKDEEEKEKEENAQDESKEKSTEALFYKRLGRSFTLRENTQLDSYIIFYVGKEGTTLTNLMMTFNKNKFYTYDPDTKSARIEDLNVNKALMKRYYMIQKAKEAQTVGIVAGTLGVADYLDIIERLKRLLNHVGKKYYTFMMGKPNVPKMANFMEVDIFVLVACPENSLIDSQEFYKPIVTPFEMEVACSRAREWTGEYTTDFRQLLPGATSYVDFEETSKDNHDEPEFSLITGNLINMQKNEEEPSRSASNEIIERNSETALSTFGTNSAANFLHQRTWQGLEKKLGQTEVITAIEGRKGTSVGYTHELEENKSSWYKSIES